MCMHYLNYFAFILLALCAEISTISTIFFAVGLDGLDLSTTGSRMFSAFTEHLNNRSGIQKNRAL